MTKTEKSREIRELRRALKRRRKAFTELAHDLGCTQAHVSMVLSGRRRSERVLVAVRQYLAGSKEVRDE